MEVTFGWVLIGQLFGYLILFGNCFVMAEQNNWILNDVMVDMSDVLDPKLTGTNFLDWKNRVSLYLRCFSKDDHLTNDPPQDDTCKEWLRDDALLFLQIRNSIDNEVVSMINHCENVKALMDYLEFLYQEKWKNFHIYEVFDRFRSTKQNDQSLLVYFMHFNKIYEELKVLFPLSSDIKVQQTQREQMIVMNFLAGLDPQYDIAKSHILSSTKLPSLNEVFARLRHIDVNAFVTPSPGALINKKNEYENGRPFSWNNNRTKGTSNRDRGPKVVVCYHCHEEGHIKRSCHKLQNKYRKSHSAEVVATSSYSSSQQTGSVDEFDEFSQYIRASKNSSHQMTTLGGSNNTNTCLHSSSSKWVIDFGATNHMAGNLGLLSTFSSISSSMLVDGSVIFALSSSIIYPIPLLFHSFFFDLFKIFFQFNSCEQTYL